MTWLILPIAGLSVALGPRLPIPIETFDEEEWDWERAPESTA